MTHPCLALGQFTKQVGLLQLVLSAVYLLGRAALGATEHSFYIRRHGEPVSDDTVDLGEHFRVDSARLL